MHHQDSRRGDIVRDIATCSGASGDIAEDIAAGGLPPCLLVRRLRDSLCMSQRELSARSGLSQVSICRIEAGREAHFSTYDRLLAAMGARMEVAIRFVRPREQIVEELIADRLEAEDRRRERSRRRRRGEGVS